MSPEALASGPVRSADEVNAEIRALWERLNGRPTTPAERAAYERLVVEWAAAVRGAVVEAA